MSGFEPQPIGPSMSNVAFFSLPIYSPTGHGEEQRKITQFQMFQIQ